MADARGTGRSGGGLGDVWDGAAASGSHVSWAAAAQAGQETLENSRASVGKQKQAIRKDGGADGALEKRADGGGGGRRGDCCSPATCSGGKRPWPGCLARGDG